jgi:hypothetical protein
MSADAWGRESLAAGVGRAVTFGGADQAPRLALLKEEFRARSMRDDFRAVWWRCLGLDGRRTFCALAGLDDSPEFCKRLWESISLDNQLAISRAARKWSRLLEPMRLA